MIHSLLGSKFALPIALKGIQQLQAQDLRTPDSWDLLSTIAAERIQPLAVRRAALEALQRSDGEDATQAAIEGIAARLRNILRDSSALELRINAAEALVAWIGEAAIDDLKAFLRDPDAGTREAALRLLVDLRSPRTSTVLRTALSDAPEPDVETLTLFQWAKGFISAPVTYTSQLKTLLLPIGSALSKKERIKVAQMLNAMANWGLPSEPAIMAASLTSTDREIHKAALDAATKLGDINWREPLAGQISSGDVELRRTALNGFVTLARTFDLPALRESLRRFPQELDDSTEEAMNALVEIDASLVFELTAQPNIHKGTEPTRGAKAVVNFYGPFGRAWDLLDFPEVSIQHLPSNQPSNKARPVSAISDELRLRELRDKVKMENSRSSISGDVDDEILAMAQALIEHRVLSAIDPMLQRVRLSSTWSGAADPVIKYLSAVNAINPDLDPASLPKRLLKERRFVPFLAALCQPSALHDMADMSYLTIEQRGQAAQLLSGQSWRCSEDLFRRLAKDPSVHVRVHAAEAVGSIKAPWIIPLLHEFLSEPNVRVKIAAAKALAKIAGVESFPVIRDTVMDRETPLLVNVLLFKALAHIGTPEAVSVLVQAGALYDDSIGRHAYRILGDIRAIQVVPELLKRLRRYEVAVQAWRAHRDQRVDDVFDRSTIAKPKGPQRPSGYTLFELITTLARLADVDTAIPLLHHDLTDVREAAAMGLALRGRVEVVEKLDALRAAPAAASEPVFRHAAFNCLDTTLEVIQKVGTATELTELRELRKRVKDRDGVLARIDWTIGELEARIDGHKRAADAENR